MAESQRALAYSIISEYWRDRYAKRSGLAYMKHIDDGLRILDAIGAGDEAAAAFCLHPLFQGAEDAESREPMRSALPSLSAETIEYARDYARIANSYLSRHFRSAADPVPLSVHKAVNDMLIADKVQNNYDFRELNPALHQENPPRVKILTQYFANWLRALEVGGERRAELESLIAPPDAYLRAKPAPP